MRRYMVLWFFVAACSGGTEAPSSPEATPAPVASAPRAPKVDPVDQARAATLAGGGPEAVTQARALLEAKPEDPKAWRLLGYAGAADPRALFDELDSTAAIGNMSGPHHLLRAELALAAGSPELSATAARAAAVGDANGASAVLALAARAGAHLEPPVVPAQDAVPDPMVALPAYVSAATAAEAAPWARAAEGVGGWRAALARAEALLAWGQTARAVQELDKAEGDDDPRARVRAELARARLLIAHGGEEGLPEQGFAAMAAWSAGQAAAGDGDGASVALALSLLDELAANGGEPTDCAQQAQAILKAVGEAGGKPGLPQVEAARLLLRLGRLSSALELAHSLNGADGPPDRLGRARWIEALVTAKLGEPPGDPAGLSEPWRGAIDALRALGEGDPGLARTRLQQTALPARDGALLRALIAAHSREDADYSQASAAARAAGDRLLALQVDLEAEQAARLGNRGGQAAARLAALRVGASPALLAELDARALLAGAAGGMTSKLDLPILAAWRALAGQGAPAAADPTPAPFGAWISARSSQEAGSWRGALKEVPLHRSGWLGTGTVLDASQGLPVAADLVPGQGDAGLERALAAHELIHRARVSALAGEIGPVPAMALSAELRHRLADASASLRAGIGAWQLGGSWPGAELQALEAVEADLRKEPAATRFLSAEGPSLASLRERLNGSALLSYIHLGGRISGLAISPDGGLLLDLGPTGRVDSLIAEHRAALERAASTGRPLSPTTGEAVRDALVDPFLPSLAGVGRYLFVAEPNMLQFSIGTLPEQRAGLRFLADIRTVGQGSSLQELTREPRAATAYKPDFLAFGAPQGVTAQAEGSEAPPEAVEPDEAAPAPRKPQKQKEEGVEAAPAHLPTIPFQRLPRSLAGAARHFSPEFREVWAGEEATRANLAEKLPHARFIHLAQMDPSADGGFILADGAFSLGELRASPIVAELVVITAVASPAVQLARVEAFLAAGARAVLVSGWALPDQIQERYVDGFYDAFNRDRPPARALAEGRQGLLADPVVGASAHDPSLWGAMMLFGLP